MFKDNESKYKKINQDSKVFSENPIAESKVFRKIVKQLNRKKNKGTK